MLEPLPVDINKLVQVIQGVYPAQVVQYSPGASKKDEAKASDAVTTGNKDNLTMQVYSHPKARIK